MNEITPDNQAKLLNQIDSHFNLDEIDDICFRLQIDTEHLKSDSKRAKVRSLLQYVFKRSDLERLLDELRRDRPKIAWLSESENRPEIDTPIDSNPEDDVVEQDDLTASYSISLAFDEEGKPKQKELEIFAIASEALFAVENDLKIICDVEYQAINVVNQKLSEIGEEDLDAGKRVLRIQLLKLRQDLVRLKEIFCECIEIMFDQSVFSYLHQAENLSHSIIGLAQSLFGNSKKGDAGSEVGLDIYHTDYPEIYTVIYLSRDAFRDEGEQYRFLGGGWKLIDLPGRTMYENAIPAILLEYYRVLVDGEAQLSSKDILNLHRWEVGLH